MRSPTGEKVSDAVHRLVWTKKCGLLPGPYRVKLCMQKACKYIDVSSAGRSNRLSRPRRHGSILRVPGQRPVADAIGSTSIPDIPRNSNAGLWPTSCGGLTTVRHKLMFIRPSARLDSAIAGGLACTTTNEPMGS